MQCLNCNDTVFPWPSRGYTKIFFTIIISTLIFSSHILCVFGNEVANSYTEYGCDNWSGFYSSGQCVTEQDGTSTIYQCNNGQTTMTRTLYTGDECDGEISLSEELSDSWGYNCSPDQTACDYAVYTEYETNDGTCNKTKQGTWDTYFVSYFINICQNKTDYYGTDTSVYITCTKNQLVENWYNTQNCSGNGYKQKSSPWILGTYTTADYTFYCSPVGVESECNAKANSCVSNFKCNSKWCIIIIIMIAQLV